jgi:hypothetical protein
MHHHRHSNDDAPPAVRKLTHIAACHDLFCFALPKKKLLRFPSSTPPHRTATLSSDDKGDESSRSKCGNRTGDGAGLARTAVEQDKTSHTIRTSDLGITYTVFAEAGMLPACVECEAGIYTGLEI